MKQSHYFIPTLRENPSDAHIPSHSLMLRAGFVRQVGAGIFSFLPLGFRAFQKAINIVRSEMDAIGAQEFLLPALNPIEIWEQTGRVEAMGDVLFHIKNREGLVLAPTHEEIITYHAAHHIKSYKELPQIWYQIQTKFRNEPRPKSGILRGRQFTMKDAYSLDTSNEGLDVNYQKHYDAYCKIFDRCGLKYFVVGASSGAMGGSKSQEFMLESDAGEDLVAIDDAGYSANSEVATSALTPLERNEANAEIEKFATPNAKTIDDLVEQFGLDERVCAKSVVYVADSKPILILMRGNDQLNETKLSSVLGTNNFRPAESSELLENTGANAGSIGPYGLKTKMRIIADNLLKNCNGLVSGANEDGFHFKNLDINRDAKIEGYFDLRTVQDGEPSIESGKPLRIVKAIELGHIFKLGTRYSESLNARFLDSEGKEKPIIMGSYGIGIERILASYIEQNFDDKGVIWNKSLAPFTVHILTLAANKFENVKTFADELYDKLIVQGIEVLYDDRNEGPGVKFNDADLIGMPIQVIIGNRGLEKGELEVKLRRSGERLIIPVDNFVAELQKLISQLD
ncbi:MAG: proline--tRNA ligase [Ignavibacteria bacterium GWF2_33_9]|nr:MAG: proline--tRNA ligase [Ignavibacteria bacterium GWF2_33_9]